MTQAQAAIERLALADWKNTGGGGNSAIANDHPAVMQRGFRMKNSQSELDGKIGVERHPRLFVDADRSVTFDRDQRAKLFVRELSDSLGNVVHCFPLLACQGKNRMTAKLGKAAP